MCDTLLVYVQMVCIAPVKYILILKHKLHPILALDAN